MLDVRTTDVTGFTSTPPAARAAFGSPNDATIMFTLAPSRAGELTVVTNGPGNVIDRHASDRIAPDGIGESFSFFEQAFQLPSDVRGAYRTLVTFNGHVAACVEWVAR